VAQEAMRGSSNVCEPTPSDIGRHGGLAKRRRRQPSPVDVMATVAMFVIVLSSDVIVDVTAASISSNGANHHRDKRSTLLGEFVKHQELEAVAS